MRAIDQRAGAILRRLKPGAALAEVGVLIGALSELILRQRPDVTLLLMVDNWQTVDQQPAAYKATRDIHALHSDPARVASHRAQAEARAALFPGRARIMAMESAAAAQLVPDHSLDLVFIDADHSFEGVSIDIAAWLPKLRAGGWIGGHDYRNPDPAFRFGVDRAVDEWAAAGARVIETDANFTWWSRVTW